MISHLMPPMYVAMIYAASRYVNLRGNVRHGLILDAIILNWLCCEVAREIIVDYRSTVASYIIIDLCSALWVKDHVNGKVAGIALIFYIAMILFNTAFFFMHAFDANTHWAGLSVISWLQLLCVCGGIMRHDIVEAVARFATWAGLKRHLGFRNKEADR